MGEFFPSPDTADPYGLVAVTDEMTPELVLEAYRGGIFPWSTGPVRWYSPDPRAIFLRDTIHISRRLQRDLKNGRFRVTFDTEFEAVMRACAPDATRNPARGSPRRSSRPIAPCTSKVTRTAPKFGRTTSSSAASMAYRS